MRRRAFTLLEVLVALGLMAMLAGSLWAFMDNLGRTRRVSMAEAREQRSLTLLMDRLEDDLTGAIAGDSSMGAGILGTSTSLSLISRGVGIPLSAEGGVESTKAMLSDLRTTRYRFDRGSGTIRASRAHGAGGGGGGEEPAAEGVALVRFRYFDGREWRTEFDSLKAGTLPVAMEVSIWQTRGGPVWGEDQVMPESEGGVSEALEDAEPARPADRVRLLVVPDGPGAGWKGDAP
mgnify:CR=1 FL=1